MRFSELWLREWLNLDLDSEKLANQITMSGLEVKEKKSVSGAFDNVVIGKIIEYDNNNKYLNIEEFHIVKVDIGIGRLLNVICNIPNCYLGLKAAVATIGSAIFTNFFKIKKKDFFGKPYEGIFCSFYELGILDNYNNNEIIKFPEDAPIGVDVKKYLKLNDSILKINVTSNRSDCLSVMGIARNITMFNQTKFNTKLNFSPLKVTINNILPVQIKEIEACPRYLVRIIKNININSITPLWMKEKLRRCGIKSTNVAMDISNYILLEIGQPVQIFDEDCIKGGIIVRMARNKEKLLLLDGNEIKLNSDILVTADYEKIISLSGISIGKHSSFKNETKNILIECAFFNSFFISKNTKHFSLKTNLSSYYEKGIDPSIQHKAMEYTTKLFFEICGGKIGPIIDITNKKMLPKRISIILHREKLDQMVGYHISDKKINNILYRIGCEVIEKENKWKTIIPNWRFDIKIEEDLIEEIVRIYGYNNIPNNPIYANLIITKNSYRESDLSIIRVKNILNERGYQEIITYSFINPKLQKILYPNRETLVLLNPISDSMSVMRLSLISNLLNTIIYNQKRQQNRIRIFEIGFCFTPSKKKNNFNFQQDLMLSGAIYGNRYQEHWDFKKKIVDFYDMKGDLESIFDLTGKLSKIEFRTEKIPSFLHLKQSATIYLHDKKVGFVGTIHPELEKKLELKNRTIVFEIEWNKISKCIIPKAKELSHFPINRRDISFFISENVLASDILSTCKKIIKNQLIDINLFDIHKGERVKKGYKSVSISLFLQGTSHTLKEEEISLIILKCIKKLKNQFQILLRN